jgi:hypothetical protein
VLHVRPGIVRAVISSTFEVPSPSESVVPSIDVKVVPAFRKASPYALRGPPPSKSRWQVPQLAIRVFTAAG